MLYNGRQGQPLFNKILCNQNSFTEHSLINGKGNINCHQKATSPVAHIHHELKCMIAHHLIRLQKVGLMFNTMTIVPVSDTSFCFLWSNLI